MKNIISTEHSQKLKRAICPVSSSKQKNMVKAHITLLWKI